MKTGWGALMCYGLIVSFIMLDVSLDVWRGATAVALLTTAAMMYHPRLRAYLLLASCGVLAGATAVIMKNIGANF
ncbi:DUF1435 family protein [Apirhabdus apintestini]|nr:DUF1435 family protein [Enterobacteriaceae bacterium CA-0114]